MPTDEARELLERLSEVAAPAYDIHQRRGALLSGEWWESFFALEADARAYLARAAEGREESVWAGTVDSENPRIASHDHPPRSSAQGARRLARTILGSAPTHGDPKEGRVENAAGLIDAYATALAAERVRERDREWWGAICPGGKRDPVYPAGPMDPEAARDYVIEWRQEEADERVREALEKAAGALENLHIEEGAIKNEQARQANNLAVKNGASVIRALIPKETR